MWENKHIRFIGGLYNVQTEFSEDKVYCLLIKLIRGLPELFHHNINNTYFIAKYFCNDRKDIEYCILSK